MRCILNGIARNGVGHIVPSATVSVYLTGTTTAASIYTTLSSTTAVNSVTAATDGTFTLYVDRFDYDRSQCFDIAISKSGYDASTWSNVNISEVVLGTYTISTDKTVTTDLGYIPKGVIYSVSSGKTLTISGPFEAGLYQVFDCVGTGSVTGLKESDPRWFGGKIDNITDDHAAWQAAFNATATNGAVIRVPIGTSYVASPIVWPKAGAGTREIKVKGQDAGPVSGNPATVTGGVSAIRYGGSTGSLFDMRNNAGENLNWNGSIEDVHLWGPNSGTEMALNIYSMLGARIKNVHIKYFKGYGVYVSNHIYYSNIEGLRCQYNGYGFYAQNSQFNGATIKNSTFSNSVNDGLVVQYGGTPINIEGCWFEGNGRYGLNVVWPTTLNLTGSYFEGNVAGDLVVTSSPFYRTVINVTGNKFNDTDTHYSIYLYSSVQTLNASGNYFGAYSNNRYIEVTPDTRGTITGNSWATSPSGTLPILNRYFGNFLWNDGVHAPYRPNYSNVMPKGTFVRNSDPLKNGGVFGWTYTVPGAGTGTDPLTTTASTTASSSTITLPAATSLPYGSAIMVSGVTFGPDADSYAVVIGQNSGSTTATLDKAANQTVTGAAVSWNIAQFKEVVGQVYHRTTTNKATAGTGEQDLATTTVPANYMGLTSGLKILAAGIKTGSAGSKTVKLHFGSKVITLNPPANDTNDWRIEAYAYGRNSYLTAITWVGWNGSTPLQGYEECSEDIRNPINIKITGECADGNDKVTKTLLLVTAE